MTYLTRDRRDGDELDAAQVVRLVGHELRNRLGVLSNSAYYLSLRLGDASDDKLARHLNLINREIAASNRTLLNLMDWMQAQEPAVETVNLNVLMEQLLRRNPAPPGVKIQVLAGSDLPAARADVAQLEQALGNLLAYEFALLKDGGTLELSARREMQGVALYMADSYAALDSARARALFDLVPDDHFSPLNMGLIVARRLIALNRGELVVNTDESQAWRFCVKLGAV